MKQTRLKTRTWILILAAIAGICLLAILAPSRTPKRVDETPGQTAEASEQMDGTPERVAETSERVAAIYLDGELVRRVDLNGVTEAEHYRVESHGGWNDILIEPGRICVESADCPDQICVMEGWLPDFGLPIVCLPHELIIEIEEAP